MPNENENELQPLLFVLKNDGINTNDKLGYTTYAEALEDQLRNVESPMTVGIFAKWGSGKSFLLRLLKDSLKSSSKVRSYRWVAVLILVLLLISTWFAIAFVTYFKWNSLAGVILITIGALIFILLLLVMCMNCQTKSPKLCTLLIAAFSKIPKECGPIQNGREFIYVDFNAWEHGGSDDIWAAIVTSIVDSVEEKIGTFAVRVFRSINIQKSDIKKYNGFPCHMCKHCTTTLCIPDILLLVFALAFIVSSVVLLLRFFVDQVWQQALVWIVPGLSVLGALLRLVYPLLNSQKARIRRALDGTRKSMGDKLGFMKLVKDEVRTISDLILCLKFVEGVDYKIVLAVDDLDRVRPEKVRSVLEAVNILLSDQSSPFFCLIAVDPRVAVNSLEQRSPDDNKELPSGNEYMKKIINLPFCLPEITHKIPAYVKTVVKKQLIQEENQQHTAQEEQQSDETSINEHCLSAARFFKSEFCTKYLSQNARSIKRTWNVVLMAISFLKYHSLKVVFEDCLSVRLPKEIWRSSSVQEDHETSIQDFINIVKKKDQTTKVKKCFGNMTNMTEEVKDKINEILSLLTERSTIKDFRDKLLTQLIEDLVLLILMIEQWPAFMARQVFYALDDRTLEPERDARRTFKDHSLYKHAEKRVKPSPTDEDPLKLEQLLIEMDRKNMRLTTIRTRCLRKYALNFNTGLLQSFQHTPETEPDSSRSGGLTSVLNRSNEPNLSDQWLSQNVTSTPKRNKN